MSSLAIQAKEAGWLDQLRCGLTIRQIADSAGVKVRRIQLGIARARKRSLERYRECASTRVRRGPRLVPLFPIMPFRPFNPGPDCPHKGPIREGSILCCMVCHQSGMDGHRALQRDPRTDPKPEPKLPERPKPRLTRKERRKEKFQQHEPGLS